MDRYLNSLRRHAAALDNALSQPRFGTVTSVDPATHSARVLLQPEGVQTGWLPIGTQAVGAGVGIAVPYRPGDQVVVMPTQNSIENGVILCGVYSDQQPPPSVPSVPKGDPSHVEAGGFAIVHPSGSSIRINADGTIILTASTLNVVGDLTMTGNLRVGGFVNAQGNVVSQMDVIANGGQSAESLIHHTHRDSLGKGTTPPI